MSAAKRHHYLAETYLEGFSADGRGVWVYDISKQQLRGQTIKDTCVQSHYNALVSGDGTRHLEIERMLNQIEGDAKQVIVHLDKGGRIDASQKAALALFIAFQKVRVPEFEDQVNATSANMMNRMTRMSFADVERARESIKSVEEKNGKPAGVTPEEMVEFVAKGEYDLKIHRNHSLEQMVRLAPDFANYFVQMEWTFLRAPADSHFLTTDSSFIMLPPPDWEKNNPLRMPYGMLTRGVRKVFPLSSRLAVVMFDHGEVVSYKDATPAMVTMVNEQLAADAYRFIVGPAEHTVHSICAKVRDILSGRAVKWGGSKLVIG
jgi:hypothetical protein